MTKLDQETVRVRMVAVLDAKTVTRRTLAQKTGIMENSISAFRKGSAWGSKRLERMKKALDEVEADVEAPTEEAPGEGAVAEERAS